MGVEGEASTQIDPLLQTKLFIPAPKDDLVRRQRLIDLLNADLISEGSFTRKLTLISAPAGYGKTTLASQWLKESELPVGWLSLDAGENDPTRFLTYLVAAVQRVEPQLAHSVLIMLQSPQQPPQERILTAFINDMAEHQGPLLLVLDDYHVIQAQPVHESLNFLVTHLSANVHLVICSREDPPLPLHRLQARREVFGIRQAELTFDVDEVLAFFQAVGGRDLSQEQAASLIRRTEGWATGLQLAALSMRSSPDLNAFIDSFTGSNRYILDYLFEEVFDQQPEEVKTFLLQTAILNRICASLADAVTARTDSHLLLEQLEHANFFIIPLDQTREWYRYHRLLTDLLRHRLGQSALDEAGLHERAGNWHAEHGYLEQAINHALTGKLWQQGGGWIKQASDQSLRRGEVTTLLNWCKRLPEEVLFSDPELALVYAWPLILIGQTDEADLVLQKAKALDPRDEGLQGQIAAAEAFLSRSHGDMEKTIALSKKALSLLPEDDRSSRGNIAVNLGLITWHLGELDEAEAALRDALVDARASRNHYAHHTALVFLGRTLASRGNLSSAVELLDQALEMGDQVPTAVLAHTDIAAIHFERNDLQSAWEHLERASAIAERIKNEEFQIACHIQHALFHLGLNDLGAAHEAIDPALAILSKQQLPPLTNARVKSCQVRLLLADGAVDRARDILTTIPVPHDPQTFIRFIDLNTSRAQLAVGDRQKARASLNAKLQVARKSGWGYAQHALRVLLALAEESLEKAVGHLEPGLHETESQGFIRCYLNEGDAILDILAESARRGIAPSYIGSILEAAGAGSVTLPFSEGVLEPLTERELEVLHLLAAGLSNRQIAEQLVVSLGTVKSHIHHIFGKLDVSRRTEAAARARELNLI